MSEVLGILGGMGPLASAAFVRTIYDLNLGTPEQNSPVVLLYSDPTVPDRTSALLEDREDVLVDVLVKNLERLQGAGADKIIICCFTIHSVLPRAPKHLRERVISLLDLLVSDESLTAERHLMLCTHGTRRMGIFEQHREWHRVSDNVVYPTDPQQDVVHDALYQLKKNKDPAQQLSRFRALLEENQVRSFVAGCTEMHLMTRFLVETGQADLSFVDPLFIAARQLRALMQ